MKTAIEALAARLTEAGLDAKTVVEYGALPLQAHAAPWGLEVDPWLPGLERYVLALHQQGRGIWSGVRFCVPHVAAVAGKDAEAFAGLLTQVEDLLAAVVKEGADLTRTEQYGIRFAAAALREQPRAFAAVLRFARELTGAHGDPGWLLQLTIPALWDAGAGSEALFLEALAKLQRLLERLLEEKIFVGFTVATAVAALTRYPLGPASELGSWFEALAALGKRVGASSSALHPLLEHGVSALGPPDRLSSAQVTAGLKLALCLADHGVNPTPTLGTLARLDVAVDLRLEAAWPLALEGIDPHFVIGSGLPACLARRQPEQEEQALLMRIVGLARALHGHGLRLRPTFEEGLAVLFALSEELPARFDQGFALAESMAARGLDPGVTLTFGLPRALARGETDSWLWDESLELAGALVDVGLDPSAALSYAVRPLRELAGGDREAFRRVRRTVELLCSSLHALGMDPREVLFHDIRSFAEAGGGRSEAFTDFVARLSTLLSAFRERSLDPGLLLTRALPEAGRAAAGKPWVLVSALELAQRLVDAGRGAQVAALLEHGAGRLSDAAGDDAAGFTALLGAWERGHAGLPPEAMEPALAAACWLAKGDAAALERCLLGMSQGLAPLQVDSTRQAIGSLLPSLAAMGSSAEELVLLMGAAAEEATKLAAEPQALAAWLSDAVPAAAGVARGKSGDGIRLLRALASRAPGWSATAMRAARLAGTRAGQLAGGDAGQFLLLFDRILEASHQVVDAGDSRGHALPWVVSMAFHASEGDAAAFLDALKVLEDVFKKDEDELRPERLRDVESLVARWPASWKRLVVPTLRAHRRGVPVMLQALGHLGARHVRQVTDLDVLREVLTQGGVRSLDILVGLLIPALDTGVLSDLTAQRDVLLRYLAEVAIYEPSLLQRYLEIHRERDLSEADKRTRAGALRQEIHGIAESLRAASVSAEQERSPLFGIALTLLFPPAVSVTREHYQHLYRTFPDRPGDLLARKLEPSLERRAYALERGSWQLREGGSLDRTAWEWLLVLLAEAGEEGEAVPAAAMGWELLQAWNEGRVGQKGPQRKLLLELLRSARRAGLTCPDEARTAAQLIALKELVADRVRDLVEGALLAARTEDRERYQRWVETKLAPPPHVGPGLAKGVQATLAAWREGRLSEQEASTRLRGQLHAFELDPALFLEAQREPCAVAQLQVLLEQLPARKVEFEPGKEVHRLHADLVGPILQTMQRELEGRPGEPGNLVYQPGSEAMALTLQITKRRAHAGVGFTEGVCVVTDVTLWNNPDFFQVVFWSTEGIARGGMHLLVVQDGGRGYLTLPGINPSGHLLDLVEARLVMDAAVDYAWRLAKAWKLDGVWVPTSWTLHSNRGAIHEEVARRRWSVREVENHPFSFQPYAYAFREVFEVPEPAAEPKTGPHNRSA